MGEAEKRGAEKRNREERMRRDRTTSLRNWNYLKSIPAIDCV